MKFSGKYRMTTCHRRGAVTVQFAMTVPLLFALVFTSVEFCGINVMRHSVDNAAYEGARRGIVPGATAADVEAEAIRIMSAVGARNVTVVIDPPVINEDTPELRVTVQLPVASNGWIAPKFFATPTLTGECRLIREEL